VLAVSLGMVACIVAPREGCALSQKMRSFL
jgi:hypothetical protein